MTAPTRLCIVLHAHLPWVRHPEIECGHVLEERWLFECLSETYLPLIHLIQSLGPKQRLTLSLSPTLLEMCADDLLHDRFARYVRDMRDLAGKELESLRTEAPEFLSAAEGYLRRYEGIMAESENSVMSAIRSLVSIPSCELMTTSATHAYLPLLASNETAVKLQLEVAHACFDAHMGFTPGGFWLPECGYYSGLDHLLHEHGVTHTVLDAHGVLHSTPRPAYGIHRPVRLPSGVTAFGRNAEMSALVWDAHSGYPGHPVYRDFHCDAASWRTGAHMRDYIRAYLPDSERAAMHTGLKYHAVGTAGNCQPYDSAAAHRQTLLHAEHFVENISALGRDTVNQYGFSPVVTVAFDAELFGHWWAEGITWLGQVLKLCALREDIQLCTLSNAREALDGSGEVMLAEAELSSWGQGGYGETWAQGFGAEGLSDILRLSHSLNSFRGASHALPERQVLLSEYLRQVLMLQSGDWGFLMYQGRAETYAGRRFREHLQKAMKIYKALLAEEPYELRKGEKPFERVLAGYLKSLE